MKAFISYSHSDSAALDTLHKHLAQLQRDGLIQTWEDREILAGGTLESNIFHSLEGSQIFIALLSPDYIASKYCYEKEFKKALQMQEEESLTIVPVVVEPCDWQNTPFSKFKALPKDGKAISTWENKNTAFLDVIQNIRKLVQAGGAKPDKIKASPVQMSRNYRVQKDFDSIEKQEFMEKTFYDVKDLLNRYIDEIIQVDNIKVRILKEEDKAFECLLVNRNKIAAESRLTINTISENNGMGFRQPDEKQINYKISNNNNPAEKNFKLAHDDYQLFWIENSYYSMSGEKKQLTAKDITDLIWNEWLESVGIL
jgi:hypothetical protein